ncbi:pol [Symbiodinium sp. CCMP2592]|nr:pol [Symbiodinium sp. CCMP2592]
MAEAMPIDLGSPTEIAEGTDEELEPKLEKRKREDRDAKKARADGAAKSVPDDSDEEFDSPSKRASTSDDRPLTASLLRDLLLEHRKDMQDTWRSFEHRIGKVETQQKNQVGEISSLSGRVKINEKDVAVVKKNQQTNDKKVEKLVEDVANLKVQLEGVQQSVGEVKGDAKMDVGGGALGGVDPWADYLRTKRPPFSGGHPVPSGNPAGSNLGSGPGASLDHADGLSEEDRRTLIIGGWMQDTRRATIEEESQALLQHPEIRPLLDSEKLAIYGPRRSVGMLRFSLREGEKGLEEVKSRMWQVVKKTAALKLNLASARDLGEDRTMWAAFVKTKTARVRSAHISLVRRVCISLASDSKNDAGAVLNLEHAQIASYDMDWGAGTIWCGIHKLASSTHRSPKDAETILMTGGWINLDAIGLIAGGTNLDLGANFTQDSVHERDQSKTRRQRVPVKCERHRWGRVGQWNLAGQKIDLLDVAGRDLDMIFVQEIARDEMGWNEENSEHFHWVTFRSASLYRGVGIGIANDKLDCIIQKTSSSRGMWVLARIRGLGRVALGSMHCHTGATNAIFQAAVQSFVQTCPRKWRQYPAICGIDVNEELHWAHEDDDVDHNKGVLTCGAANLNELVHQMLQIGLSAVAPRHAQWLTPSHFPRDDTRRGRQIDALWCRQIGGSDVSIDTDRRHVIGSDHGLVHFDVFTTTKSVNRWGNDSRPRYVCRDLPDATICDADDLAELAKTSTAPRFSTSYKDSDEIKSLCRQARVSNDKKIWKKVHKLRRSDRREWEKQRLAKILHGDWDQYRCLQREKKTRKGWWGRMLENRSSLENTNLVKQHLESKLVNEYGKDWDELLQMQIDSIPVRGEFVDFTAIEVRTVLQQMKANSAVGPDGIGVSFLRAAMSHDIIMPQLLSLINHIIKTLELPAKWEENFLALLAKCDIPEKPGDLRPICVSSVFHKLVTKLVCARSMPSLRSGSRLSGCGKGRQAADIIGTVSRLRDVTHEWKLPVLLCKLDISGAFDKLDRQRVVEFLKGRLADKDLDHELRYLLMQLQTYALRGRVPGGHDIEVRPNIGIKQGAPESAEVFGLVMDALLMKLTSHAKWKDFGLPLPGLDITLIFYQDDIFVVESELVRLGRRIKVLERTLAQYGLKLAAEKTKIIASSAYRGPRKIKIGETLLSIAPSGDSVKVLGISFNLQDSPSQQAKEILQRTRTAAAVHGPLLRGRANWHKKASMITTLVESQFAWSIWGHYVVFFVDLRDNVYIEHLVGESAYHYLQPADPRPRFWNILHIGGIMGDHVYELFNDFYELGIFDSDILFLKLPWAWGDIQWDTEPFSETAWDTNISIAIQADEFHGEDLPQTGMMTGSGPPPEDLPVPFLVSEEGRPASSSEEGPRSSTSSWWEAVRDRRSLRGRAPTNPVPAEAPAEPDAPTVNTMDEGPAVTQRFGVVRAGTDRWHHPNGAVKNRRRERLAAESDELNGQAADSHNHSGTDTSAASTLPAEPFTLQGWGQHPEGPVVDAVTFYGEGFQVWASGNMIAGDAEANVTTTAGNDSSSGAASIDMEYGTNVNVLRKNNERMSEEVDYNAHENDKRDLINISVVQENTCEHPDDEGDDGVAPEPDKPVADGLEENWSAHQGPNDHTSENWNWGWTQTWDEHGNWWASSSSSWHDTGYDAWSWRRWTTTSTTSSAYMEESSWTSPTTTSSTTQFDDLDMVTKSLSLISLADGPGRKTSMCEQGNWSHHTNDTTLLEDFSPFPDAWGAKFEIAITSTTSSSTFVVPNHGLFPDVRRAGSHEALFAESLICWTPWTTSKYEEVGLKQDGQWRGSYSEWKKQRLRWKPFFASFTVGFDREEYYQFNEYLDKKVNDGEGESEGIVGASPSSEAGMSEDMGNGDGVERRPTSRSRSRSRSSVASVWDSEFAFGSDGELVQVPVADPDAPLNGPPPPAPVHQPQETDAASASSSSDTPPCTVTGLVSLEPVGIWAEPPLEEPHEVTPSSSSTTTTTLQYDVPYLEDEMMLDWTTLTLTSTGATCWMLTGLGGTCSSTSTTSTTSTLVWPADHVRDAVNTNLIHGGIADVVQFIQLLLEHQRRLRHQDRLVSEAITAVLQVVARETAFGSGPSAHPANNVVNEPSVGTGGELGVQRLPVFFVTLTENLREDHGHRKTTIHFISSRLMKIGPFPTGLSRWIGHVTHFAVKRVYLADVDIIVLVLARVLVNLKDGALIVMTQKFVLLVDIADEAIEQESGIGKEEQQLLAGCAELRDDASLEDASEVTLLRRSPEKVDLLRSIDTCEGQKVLFLLRTAPSILRSDREVIFSAVQKNGLALRFAAPSLRAEKDVVMAAVSQCGRALQHASEELQTDRELAIAALQASPDEVPAILPAQLAGDKETMLALVRMSGVHLSLADERLRADPEVVLAALGKDVIALQMAADELKSDGDFMLSAISENPAAFLFSKEELQQDDEFVARAMQQHDGVGRFILQRQDELRHEISLPRTLAS